MNISDKKLSGKCSKKLEGIKIGNKLIFEDRREEMCKKASQNSVRWQQSLMRSEQKKSIVNSFITSHFSYCQFVWMFHSRSLKHINQIHERTLRVFLKIIIPL